MGKLFDEGLFDICIFESLSEVRSNRNAVLLRNHRVAVRFKGVRPSKYLTKQNLKAPVWICVRLEDDNCL